MAVRGEHRQRGRVP